MFPSKGDGVGIAVAGSGRYTFYYSAFGKDPLAGRGGELVNLQFGHAERPAQGECIHFARPVGGKLCGGFSVGVFFPDGECPVGVHGCLRGQAIGKGDMAVGGVWAFARKCPIGGGANSCDDVGQKRSYTAGGISCVLHFVADLQRTGGK